MIEDDVYAIYDAEIAADADRQIRKWSAADPKYREAVDRIRSLIRRRGRPIRTESENQREAVADR